MSIVGIVAEYNPFHNGHKYQIEMAKKLTGAHDVIVIMSGNYVQRGAPSVFNKHLRAKCAIESGASMVFELPVCYSTASAELFAHAAITFFNKLGVIDFLSFGCEWDNIYDLQKIADTLVNEPEQYKKDLKKYLSAGKDFPSARFLAIKDFFGDSHYSEILTSPNNILAIEYLKALIKTNSKIKPVPVRRCDNGFHSKDISGDFASATGIRNYLIKEQFNLIKKVVPQECYDIYMNNTPIYSNDFSMALGRQLAFSDSFHNCHDISSFLSNRILNIRNDYEEYDSFSRKLLTKNETSTHINRALLHIMLDIREETVENYIKHGLVFYAKPLAFNINRSAIIKDIKNAATIPYIQKYAAFYRDASDIAKDMLNMELRCDRLYNLVYKAKTGIKLSDDFTKRF